MNFGLALVLGFLIGITAEAAVVLFQRERYQFRLRELMLERSKTDAILESVGDGLIVLGMLGEIVHINEIACAILSLEKSAVEGDYLRAVARSNPPVARLLAAREHPGDSELGAPAEFDVFIRGRDHSYVSREMAWRGPDGASLGTILLLQDVTYIRDQERARTNLIATLSHELKTPLTSLAIGSELLSERPATNDAEVRQSEILGIIHNDVARLKTIADNLLDASRSTTARIAVERREFELDRVAREVIEGLSLQAREKGVTIDLVRADAGLRMIGDPIKMPWVISNLIGNAMRYSPSGGKIEVALTREASAMRLTVTDGGPGIAADVMPRIFEPYAQFGNGKNPMGSAGLGLHIAKEIVEAHGGRIFARNREAGGAEFTVEIPLAEGMRGQNSDR